jgi:ligand-binding sensor protein
MMTGGWEYADMKPCDLPEKVATAFSQAMKEMVSVEYIPVLYVGKQVVNGMNYCILCQTALITPEKSDGCKVVIIYAPLNGDAVVTHIYNVIR